MDFITLINILVDVSFLSRRGSHVVNLYWYVKFMNQLLKKMSRKLTLLSLTIDEHEKLNFSHTQLQED